MSQVVIENPVINSPFDEPTRHFRFGDEGNDEPWLAECVVLKDHTFPQLLFPVGFAHDATGRIYQAVVPSTGGTASLKPILRPYDTVGSTRYVKNHNLGFTIPYTLNGEEKGYIPDFIACIANDHGDDDLLHLIVEVSGEQRKDKAAKVTTARALWVPAVDNHGGLGRWAFIEIDDPWNAQNTIRGFVQSGHG